MFIIHNLSQDYFTPVKLLRIGVVKVQYAPFAAACSYKPPSLNSEAETICASVSPETIF